MRFAKVTHLTHHGITGIEMQKSALFVFKVAAVAAAQLKHPKTKTGIRHDLCRRGCESYCYTCLMVNR
jgi:hypothetical protein